MTVTSLYLAVVVVTRASCPIPELPLESRTLDSFILLLVSKYVCTCWNLFHTYKQILILKRLYSTAVSQHTLALMQTPVLIMRWPKNAFLPGRQITHALCNFSKARKSRRDSLSWFWKLVLRTWKLVLRTVLFCCFSTGIRRGTWSEKNKWQIIVASF